MKYLLTIVVLLVGCSNAREPVSVNMDPVRSVYEGETASNGRAVLRLDNLDPLDLPAIQVWCNDGQYIVSKHPTIVKPMTTSPEWVIWAQCRPRSIWQIVIVH